LLLVLLIPILAKALFSTARVFSLRVEEAGVKELSADLWFYSRDKGGSKLVLSCEGDASNIMATFVLIREFHER
jgi:hypothetical protein